MTTDENFIVDDDSNSIVHVEDENPFIDQTSMAENFAYNKEREEQRKIKRDARMGVFTNVKISPKKI